MVKIGDTFFVSSVEVKVPTRVPQPVDGYDPARASATCSRSTGRATSSPISRSAKARSITRAASTTTAPDIWVPVAEYRPDSRSIVYRVDPADDEGDRGVPLRRSHRRDRPQHRRPHAARRQLGLAPVLSLDARRATARVTNAGAPPESCARSTRRTTSTIRTASMPAARRMLCTGVTEMRQSPRRAAVPARRHRPRRSRATAGRCTRCRVLLWTPAAST